jgi:hypothetical protein
MKRSISFDTDSPPFFEAISNSAATSEHWSLLVGWSEYTTEGVSINNTSQTTGHQGTFGEFTEATITFNSENVQSLRVLRHFKKAISIPAFVPTVAIMPAWVIRYILNT